MQLCSFSASSLLFLSSRVTDPGKKKIRRAKKLSLPVTAIRKTCWFVVKIDQKYMHPSTCTSFLDEKIAKIFKISTICIIRFNFFKTSKFNFIPFLSLDRQLFSRLLHLYPLLSNLHIQTFLIDVSRLERNRCSIEPRSDRMVDWLKWRHGGEEFP